MGPVAIEPRDNRIPAGTGDVGIRRPAGPLPYYCRLLPTVGHISVPPYLPIRCGFDSLFRPRRGHTLRVGIRPHHTPSRFVGGVHAPPTYLNLGK